MSNRKPASKQKPSISVVMSVWQGDKASQIAEAIDSILVQTHKADEMIIVKDGPVSAAITSCLERYQNHKLIKIYQLKQNSGRGAARNHAIKHAAGEIIVMMDADDISRPERIEQQFRVLRRNHLDILGCFIEEFVTIPGDLKDVRQVPLQQTDIEKMVRMRSAFNHVTLMFSKSFFDKINGYSNLNYVEDWDFYLRSIQAGGKVQNIPLVLVDVRKSVWRRRSYQYLREEISVAFRAFQRRQIPPLLFMFSVILRVGKFLTPAFALNMLYHKVLRQRQD